MSTSDLMNFRTTYLRAIAQAWFDPEFASKLTIAGKGADALKDQFSYTWPWPDLILTVRDHGAEWNPSETGGWSGSIRDEIWVNLPLDPARIKGLRPEDHARAIAAYYQQYTTFLGPGGPPNPTKETGNHLQAYDPGLGSWDGFLHFGAATFRALALAWHNETFRKELQNDALLAMESWVGYSSPWNFKILFFDKSAQCTWNEHDCTWKLPRNELVLWLPRRPDKEHIRPIALTAYNSTGEAYPFTCCT